MATNQIEVRLCLKSDTAANWSSSTLVLLKGEFAVESDTGRFKIGDGTKTYPELSYASMSQSEIETLIKNTSIGDITLVEGESNGQVGLSIDGVVTYVNVKGLGTAAYANIDDFASKDYVDEALADGIAVVDAMVFKGTLGEGGTITALPTTYKVGWTYRVISAGTYAGNVCEVGDLVVAIVERDGSDNENSDWTVAQTNIDGAIIDASDGLIVDGNTVKHTNSVTAGTAQGDTSKTLEFGGTFTVPTVSYDAQGHITDSGTNTMTMPSTVSTDLLINGTKTLILNGGNASS